jgi:UDP-N-acetylglucosamine 2-epimerase (non-hydrolysing)
MKFVLVAGARPNFMKIAPIMAAFASRHASRNGFTCTLVHTGQHYGRNMSDDFFGELGIPQPEINLAVGSGSHAEQTARIMIAFERVCLDLKPDWVVVVGDVNSTLACSITAKKLGIKVAHVEAGLRSRDMSMPEEINRLCTDAISDLMFTTEQGANDNLLREGIPSARIEFVGNTMIDTLLRHIVRARGTPLPEGLEEREYAVVTLHRPSNVDSPDALGPLFRTLQQISRSIPVVFPVHPRTRRNLESFGLLASLPDGIRLIDPLTYLPFIGLVARSRMVLTDSGGIQEETTVLGIPCITIRENTERPVTCSIGTNILVGTDTARILQAAYRVLSNSVGPTAIPAKWDGQAAERIVSRLLYEHSVPC